MTRKRTSYEVTLDRLHEHLGRDMLSYSQDTVLRQAIEVMNQLNRAAAREAEK